MWIHESFTTYSEGLFVELTEGKEAGARYIKGERKNIRNDKPIIGPYNVNTEGSGDMYFKGTNMLHTVRSIINDDAKWLSILRGLNQSLGLKTTTTEEVISYINKQSGKNLTSVFDQYLRHTEIPVLEIRKVGNEQIQIRWKADVKDFNMPLRLKSFNSVDWMIVQATSEWQSVNLHINPTDLLIDTDNFYIKTKII